MPPQTRLRYGIEWNVLGFTGPHRAASHMRSVCDASIYEDGFARLCFAALIRKI